MGILKKIQSFFKKPVTNEPQTPTFSAEALEALANAEDEVFFRDSKLWLQKFDEYITAAEIEIETVSVELDNIINLQESVKSQLKTLNKPSSWHEKSLLIKLDRLNLHGENLKKRVEIYSQNIRVYLNLMSKIQDIQAMKMNGLDGEKISSIWVQFKESLDQYKDLLLTEGAGYQEVSVTTDQLEKQLGQLREQVMPKPAKEIVPPPAESKSVVEEAKRPPLKDLLNDWEPEPPIRIDLQKE